MHSIFLSHSSKDKFLIGRIKAYLAANGYSSVFLDHDARQGIHVGEQWEQVLYSRLMACDAVVALITPHSVASHWCFAEIAFARALEKKLFPLEAGAQLPILAPHQYIRLEPDLEAGLAQLLQELKRHEMTPYQAFDVDMNRPLYPGLNAFAREDAGVFFGRDAEIRAFIESLRRLAGGSWRRVPAEGGEYGALAVIGPSGSGKSSLVMAGLLPRLMQEADWCILPEMRPADSPCDELERVFENAYKRIRLAPPPDLADQLTRAPLNLLNALRAVSPGECRFFLLVLDQFEEIFTRTEEAERVKFFDRLKGMLQPRSPLKLLLTLRSENLTDALSDPFSAALLARPETVGPLSSEQLAEVIEAPARRAGLKFEPGLVGQMVAETGGGDALPLLAYILRQLYDRARAANTTKIIASGYADLGGVRGALEHQANLALHELGARHGPQVSDQALDVLARLATLGADGRPARRPLAIDELAPLDQEIVAEFVNRRLLVTRREGDTSVVEAAHEALLRQWPPLRQKLEAQSDALRWWAGLERAALEWEQAGRAEAYLWSDSRLATGSPFLETDPARTRLSLSAAFLAASRQRNRRDLSRQGDALASAILASYEEDPERGIVLALEGLGVYWPTPRMHLALARCLQANHLRQRFLARTTFTAATLSPDGCLAALAELGNPPRMLPILIERQSRTTEDRPVVGIWDASTGMRLSEIRPHDSRVKFLLFSPDGEMLLSLQQDASVCLWSTRRAILLHTLVAPQPAGRRGELRPDRFAAVFSADGAQVLLGWKGQVAQRFDCRSGTRLQTPVLQKVNEVSHDDPLNLVDIEIGWSPFPFEDFPSWGFRLPLIAYLLVHPDTQLFSPSGETCLRTNRSYRIEVDIRDGFLVAARLFRFMWSDVTVLDQNSMVFAVNQQMAARAIAERTSISFDTPDESLLLRGHQRTIFAVNLDEACDLLLSADPAEARIWDVQPLPGSSEKLKTLPLDSHFGSVALSPSGAEAWLIGHGTNEVVAVSLHSGAFRTLLALEESEYPLRFTADGQRLIVRRLDDSTTAHKWKTFQETQRMYELATGKLLWEVSLKSLAYRGSALLADDGRLVARHSSYWLDLGPAADLGIRTALPESVLPGEGELDSYGHENVVFSPDGRYLVATTAGGILKVWDTLNSEILIDDKFTGRKIVVSPDSSRLLAYHMFPAKIVHLPLGETRQLDIGSEAEAAAFSADGTQIAVGYAGKPGRVYDAESGELLLELPVPLPDKNDAQKYQFADVAFTADGRHVAGLVWSRQTGGVLVIWENPTLEDLQRRAHALPLRTLYPAERKRYGLAAG
jgi:WD40 repeat protein